MTVYPSKIRSRIKNQELLLSSLFFSREFHIASAIYQTKPDWVWIDQEHAPWGTESIGPICVMATQVDNPEEVNQAINYAKYPPIGERGIAPWFAAPMDIDVSEVVAKANEDTFLVLQMESIEAYEKIDEILEIENFEVLLVGPMDLSASLGVPGEIHHSKVETIMRNVAEKMKGMDKSLATTFFDPQDARRWIAEGYRMMNIGTVLQLGTDRTKEIFAELRAEFS